MSNKELIERLWKLVEHNERCRLTMVSPFEAECDCCETVLLNIFSAGKQEAADALAAADKRIAELEKYGRVQDPLAERIVELERKLAVAREALDILARNADDDAVSGFAKETLAQIGGEDARS